jgi:hypothetical protein
MPRILRWWWVALLGCALGAQSPGVERGDGGPVEENLGGYYFDLGMSQLQQINGFCREMPQRILTATRYETQTTIGAGATETTQAWLDECDNPLQVRLKTHGPAGDELTEYFFHSGRVILMQKLHAKSIGDDDVKVPGDRFYYGLKGVILHFVMREWTEGSATFYKEEFGPLNQESADVTKPLGAALAIVKHLISAGPAKHDPTAAPDAQKYRLIMESISPDGKYALGFGLAQQEKIDWNKYRDPKRGGYTRPANGDLKEESIRNYVIELQSGRILGETGCHYFGTQARYERAEQTPAASPGYDYDRECAVAWAPNSSAFVQTIYQGKDTASRAGIISEDGRLLGSVDLWQSALAVARSFADRAKSKRIKRDANVPEFIYRGYRGQGEPAVDVFHHVSLIVSRADLLIQEDFELQPGKEGIKARAMNRGKETLPAVGTAPAFAEDAGEVAADEQLKKDQQLLNELRELKLLEEIKAQEK